MQSSGSSGSRNCVSCGRPIAWDANVCPYCGRDYRAQMMAPAQQRKESAMPVAGGVLIMLASLGYLIIGGLIAAGSTVALMPSFGTSAMGVACGAVLLVLGLIAFMGGIFAMQRKNFGFAVVGGVLVIPSLLGLIGLILVAISRDEFRD